MSEKPKRIITPEQREKMRLGRIAKAEERRNNKAKEKELQEQAIAQQKERIEMLKVTKKKKTEIKRRLAEVKKGNTNMTEVNEIIEQYEPKEVNSETETETEPEPEPPKIELKIEAPKIEPPKIEPTKIEPPKIEPPKIEPPDPKIFYEKEFKKAVENIKKNLPEGSKPYFTEQSDKFDSNLDINENIKNMIESINKKVDQSVKSAAKVIDVIEEIDNSKDTADVDQILHHKKERAKSKLENLYKLR